MAYRGKHETHTEPKMVQHHNKKRKKSGSTAKTLIHYISIGLALVFAFFIIRHVVYGVQRDKLNDTLTGDAVTVLPTNSPKPQIQATANTEAKTPAATETPEPTPEPTPTPEMAPIDINFDKLRGDNREVIGWVYCDDTPLNYPIVQRQGDNEYYLDHLFTGAQNENGTIFADYRNSQPFEEWNTVLYGHNMKDGEMFGCIDEFGKQEFYDAHPVIYIITPEKDYKVEICCSFLTAIDAATFQFPRTPGNPAKTIDDIAKYSYIDTGLVPTEEDRLVSFSTCYEQDDQRYVVIGILRELYKET